MSDRKFIYHADKIHQRFSPPYVLKLTASQTRIFILLQSICTRYLDVAMNYWEAT